MAGLAVGEIMNRSHHKRSHTQNTHELECVIMSGSARTTLPCLACKSKDIESLTWLHAKH